MQTALAILATIAAAMLVLRLLVSLVNYISQPYLSKRRKVVLSASPLVSILVPARNEEANIEPLARCVLSSTYRNIELVVYNDASTDQTAIVAQRLASSDSRLRVVDGLGLPAGWLGKNHACHQLAGLAKGEFLLFLDADVRVSSSFIEDAVGYVMASKVKLLSLFPQQVMETRGERLAVPIMHWILLSMLPIFLVKASRKRSLSAANGQMMLFEASTYHRLEPHWLQRTSKAEDIAIAKLYKRRRERVALLLGCNDVVCRMYSSKEEAIEGFAKNVRAFFGNSLFFMLLFTFITPATPLLAALTWGWFAGVASVVGLLAVKVLTSAVAKQSVWFNVTHCVHQYWTFVMIVFRNLQSNSKKLIWKGREI